MTTTRLTRGWALVPLIRKADRAREEIFDVRMHENSGKVKVVRESRQRELNKNLSSSMMKTVCKKNENILRIHQKKLARREEFHYTKQGWLSAMNREVAVTNSGHF